MNFLDIGRDALRMNIVWFIKYLIMTLLFIVVGATIN